MADKPWSGRILTPGQIEQQLEKIGCEFVESLPGGGRVWKAPTGHHFTISYAECDAAYLEGITEQVERWVNEHNPH